MPTKIKNRIDIRYGRLIAIKLYAQDWTGAALWPCKCDCNKKIIVKGNNLQSGNTKNCGCLQRETISKLNKRRNVTGKNNSNYIHGR